MLRRAVARIVLLSRRRLHKERVMPKVTATDGTRIFYKDWGTGRPVVFSHGWPLNADMWDPQLLCMASNGFRAVAHDRRGHGRSGQPWTDGGVRLHRAVLRARLQPGSAEDRRADARPPRRRRPDRPDRRLGPGDRADRR